MEFLPITWNNLKPPGFTQKDIVEKLLKPSIFENPQFKNRIQASPFYQNATRTNKQPINFQEALLLDQNSFCSGFFNSNRSGSSEKMIELLFNTSSKENKLYTMSNFPIRYEFKKQWKNILLSSDELSSDELDEYKTYINLFFEDNLIQQKSKDDLFNKYKTKFKIDFFKKKFDFDPEKTVTVDFSKLIFSFKEEKIPFSKLLKSISASDYSKSVFQDERNELNISDEDNLFFERLATLSIIASIWYIWISAMSEESKKTEIDKKSKDTKKQKERENKRNIYIKQIERIALLIFPKENFLESNKISEEKTNDSIFESDIRKAKEELDDVKHYIQSENYHKAGKLCEKIFFTYKYATDEIKVNTLEYLIKCCENGYTIPSIFSSVDSIDKLTKYYDPAKRKDLKETPKPAESKISGRFTINYKGNNIYDWISKTSPSSWGEPCISETPEETIQPNIHQHIILIHDNFDVNLQDALNILDKIQKSINTNETSIFNWKDLELYIRCNENDIIPLLDTALSYFTEDNNIESSNNFSLIKIYLLDEAKRSVDYLFAKHPLFYPLTLSNTDKNSAVNLVIVSNNEDQRYAKWLIKEGFWMLPRSEQTVQSKITLLSPNASEICSSIKSENPGLTQFSVIDNTKLEPFDEHYEINIDDILFPEINYKNTSLSDFSIREELKKIYSSDDLLYIVVDSNSDFEGINLGTKIREFYIQKTALEGHIKNYSRKNYTIAVHCFNPDYAGLVSDLIIPKEEEHSNLWYNSYNLIPFGSLKELYSWEKLNGGIFEELAQCIHLQYSDSDYKKENCKKNLTSYFKRLYNRDSSFSVALSMPYRLFEAGITPKIWSIENPNGWWNEKIREELATEYNQKLFPNEDPSVPDSKLRERLAKYEHMRWCCWALTRGWLPVNPVQVTQYITAGVKRHTLQIAKLHPCICSWKGLELLQEELCRAALYPKLALYYVSSEYDYKEEETIPLLNKEFARYFSYKDVYNKDFSQFQKLDYRNVEKTSDILKIKWHPFQVYDNDKLIP